MSLILRFLRRYAVPYWNYYLMGVIALYLTSQLTVFVPQLVKQTIDALEAGHSDVAFRTCITLGLAAIGIMIIRTASRLLVFNPARAAEYRLKNDLFRHLIRLPKAFHDVHQVGDLMSRATNDIQSVRALLGFAGLQILEAIFVIPLSVHQMWQVDPSLSRIALSLLAVAALIQAGTARSIMRTVKTNAVQLSSLSDHVLASYTGIHVLQGFLAEPRAIALFETLNRAYIKSGLQIARLRTFLIPLVNLLGGVSLALVLWLGGRRVLDGQLGIGSLVALSGYVALLLQKLALYSWTVTVVQRGKVSLDRIYELLDAALPPEPEVTTRPLPVPQEGLAIKASRLSFRYPASPDRQDALSSLSFEVAPGQTLGIFGQTGSGKSTLVRLLAGEYRPPRGMLFLEGWDVCDLPSSWIRQHVRVVPQEPFLFSRTIRANVSLSGTAESTSSAQVEASCALACLEEDLKAMTGGMETLVGIRGVTLSGGQRQRVALARALHRPGPLLLLDDVVSAVDPYTEQRLLSNLGVLKGEGAKPSGHTLILVSHRVSALIKTDRILVLEGGRLVDQGTHEQLIGREGIYQTAHLAQQLQQEPEGLEQALAVAGG